jgi:hypothetical protein
MYSGKIAVPPGGGGIGEITLESKQDPIKNVNLYI